MEFEFITISYLCQHHVSCPRFVSHFVSVVFHITIIIVKLCIVTNDTLDAFRVAGYFSI